MPKVWFITGCSKGFGRALVQELLEATDAHVVATARNSETLKDWHDKYPDRTLTLKLDVTKQQDIEQAVIAATKKFSRIDVLVNNAGYGLAGALEECSEAEIRAQYDTNVFGLMAMTKAVLPIMRSQKSGHILNISSSIGLVPLPGLGLYSSTKFAVEGLSESLAYDVSSFGIKVSIIEPGPFRTDFAGDSLHLPPLHPDYHESPAISVREYMDKMNAAQPGDPQKAAQIMIRLVEFPDPPLRLPLGNICVDRIYKKLETLQAEFKKYEDLSRSADFDS